MAYYSAVRFLGCCSKFRIVGLFISACAVYKDACLGNWSGTHEGEQAGRCTVTELYQSNHRSLQKEMLLCTLLHRCMQIYSVSSQSDGKIRQFVSEKILCFSRGESVLFAFYFQPFKRNAVLSNGSSYCAL